MVSHFLTMTGKKESTFKTTGGTSSILLHMQNLQLGGWVGMSLDCTGFRTLML